MIETHSWKFEDNYIIAAHWNKLDENIRNMS